MIIAAGNTGHSVGGLIADLAGPVGQFFAVVTALLDTTGRIVPGIEAAVARALADSSASDVGIGVAWFAGMLLWLAFTSLLKPQLYKRTLSTGSVAPLVAFGIDVLDALLIVGLATAAAVALGPHGGAGSLAIAGIWALVRLKFGLLMIDVLLRPSAPTLRLVAVDDSVARLSRSLAMVAFIVGIGFIAVVPVLLNYGMPLPEARAAALYSGTIACLLALAVIVTMARGLPLSGVAAATALSLLALVWIAWLGGVAALRFEFYHAAMQYVRLAWAVTVLLLLVRHAERAMEQHDDIQESGRRRRLIFGGLRRSGLVVGGATAIAMAGPLGLFHAALGDGGGADMLSRALTLAAFTVGAGYLLFEALGTWTRIRFPLERPAANESDEDVKEGSRLDTVLPIIAGALIVGSIIVAVLLAMGELGINTGPLLAGAGIFGLALSFGSQAIVRDIISGLFFMSDDAFRAGEYIAVGNFKGRVEKISLRSMRLRHHNGQFHTLPFGQITAVTNFSRDWATMKFNLKLARNTDVERVRKVTKRVGLALLDDPEIGSEFILPLKMQGITEVQESALSLRFKFTAKPTKPSYVQRQALKHLYDAFAREGISFATHSVVVQPASDMTAPGPLASQGAAASAVAPRPV